MSDEGLKGSRFVADVLKMRGTPPPPAGLWVRRTREGALRLASNRDRKAHTSRVAVRRTAALRAAADAPPHSRPWTATTWARRWARASGSLS